jgi:hypothetical protein
MARSSNEARQTKKHTQAVESLAGESTVKTSFCVIAPCRGSLAVLGDSWFAAEVN